VLEALVDAGPRLIVRHGVSDLHRAVVEDRGAAAGEPERRLEPARARRTHRLLVSGGDRVALCERDGGAGARDPERLR
jgi:hypothetical protein